MSFAKDSLPWLVLVNKSGSTSRVIKANREYLIHSEITTTPREDADWNSWREPLGYLVRGFLSQVNPHVSLDILTWLCEKAYEITQQHFSSPSQTERVDIRSNSVWFPVTLSEALAIFGEKAYVSETTQSFDYYWCEYKEDNGDTCHSWSAPQDAIDEIRRSLDVKTLFKDY